MDSHSHESMQPKCTILVLEGMGAHLSQAITADDSNSFGSFLRECRRLRVELQTISGRLGVAASISTGASAEGHQMSGKVYPDPILRINRLHTPDTVSAKTIWDACESENISSLTIGWPNSTPIGTDENKTQNTPRVIIGAEAVESRNDPFEHWILPPDSVYPDNLREQIRSLRKHQQTSNTEKCRDAYIESSISIATQLLEDCTPELLACWLQIESETISSEFEKTGECFSQSVPKLLEHLHESPILIIAIPTIKPDIHTIHANVFLHNCHIETAPVIQDQHLAPMILKIMNTNTLDLPIAKKRATSFNGKEQELIKKIGPFKPSMGQQRLFMQSQSMFYLTIGLDMHGRREHKQAIPWLLASLHNSSPPKAISALILSYLATEKHEELSQFSRELTHSPVFANLASSAYLVGTKCNDNAAEKINAIADTNPDVSNLKIQLLFRINHYQNIIDLVESKESDVIGSIDTNSLRCLLIAAHRIGKAKLASHVASELLRQKPLCSRRRRFLITQNNTS